MRNPSEHDWLEDEVRVGRGGLRLAAAAFLLFLLLPAASLLLPSLRPSPPKPATTLRARLAAFEEAAKSLPLLEGWRRADQARLTAALGAGNRRVFAGGGGWLYYRPDLEVVFGKGPEAATFAALAASAGYPALLLSPDAETLAAGAAAGCATVHLTGPDWPADLAADPWTAVTLFFHDHDWEPPILAAALATPAFYIGAQGSRRSADLRLIALQARGLGPGDLARLKGPVGLIPSARDAGTLAVSVLAEVLAEAMARG